MSAYQLPDVAAKLLAISLALDDPRCTNPEPLIRTGLMVVQAVREQRIRTLPGRESAFYLDSASVFCRSVANHRPESAADWIDAAEALELGRELAIVTPSPREN